MKRQAPALLVCALAALLAACSSEDVSPTDECGPNHPCGAGFTCDKSGHCVQYATTGRADAPEPAGAPADAPLGTAQLVVDRATWDFGAVVLGQSGTSVSFTVSNQGTAAAPALDLMLSGARAPSFVIDVQSSCDGATLSPGASCTVSLTFRPDATGTITATLVIGDVSVALTGQGVPPGQIILGPSGADLGSVVQGGSSDPVVFTLRNSGGAATGPVAVALAGSDAAPFTLASDGCSGKPLAAMTSCTVSVRFAPTALGVKTASLSVSATPGGAQTAMLTGRGIAPAALRVDPATLDLGTSVVGSTIGGSITVSNAGDVATGALTTKLDGADATELGIASDGCAGVALAPGASCTIAVQALPTSTGSKTVTVVVASLAPALSGSSTVTTTAVAPGALTIDPARQSFPAVLVGSAGETVDFTVRNTGGAPTGAMKTTLAGTGKSQFAIVGDACGGKVLAPAASCTVSIQFKPTARQSHTATLGVSATPGGTASSSLTGVGLAPAALAGDATTFAFGTVDVTQASLAQTWTITNGGDVATGALSTTLDGDTADFTVTNGCGTDPLAAGKSCTLIVALAPQSGGMKSLNLTVAGTPGGSVTLMAQGTGRPPSPLMVLLGGNGTGSVSSTPDGIACMPACAASYLYGTSVLLAASPGDGSDFTAWMGACAGTGPCIVAMTAAETVTAVFTLQKIGLHVAVAGSGSVSSDPAGVSCGSTCDASYDYGTPVTLSAAPALGWSFSSWTGCPAPSAASCAVTLKQATSVTANFAPLPIPVTASVSGSGTVASTPSGISCSSGSCMASFPYGSTVKLTETPAAHQHFTGWTGACSGTATTCSFTVGIDPVAVGAGFAVDTFPLTIASGTGGTVAPSPDGTSCGAGCTTYSYGQSVTLTPTASSGYRFLSWSGDCSGGGACSVTMDQPRSVNASFIQQLGLTVTKPTGGTVTGTGGINCGTKGSACTATLDLGTSVSLTATADTGYRVGTWSGCTPGANGTCTLTLSAPTTVAQAFVPNIVTVSPRPSNGTVTGPGGINCGTSATTCMSTPLDGAVTLTATPDASYRVASWSGCTPGANNTCTLTVNGPTTVSATFVQQVQLTWAVGLGGGTLAPSPAPIASCGANCATYDVNTPVTLTATTANGTTVGVWGGACAATTAGASSCSFNMGTSSKSASVIFQQALTLNISGTGTVTSPAGSCTASCTQHLDYGTSPSLQQQPGGSFVFKGWGGACTGTGSCTPTMDQARTVSATFQQQYVLTVTKPTGGTVTGTGAINCGTAGSACTATLDSGTAVTLTATADTGYRAGTWTGCTPGANNTCTLTLGGTTTVTQSFVPNIVTVSPRPSGGTVTGPGGINCGTSTATCASTPLDGPITLTATADSGYRVGVWSGCTPGANNTCALTVNGPATVSVTFVQQVQVTWSVGAGGGTLGWSPAANGSCGAGCLLFDVNVPVTVSAMPTTGATVGAWGGTACSTTGFGASTCSFNTGTTTKSASVTFQYTVGVTINGNGTVSSPGFFSCSSSCTQHINYGNTISVQEQPQTYWVFGGWGGACTGTGGCTVSAPASVVASFSLPQYTLTVTAGSGGTTAVNGVTGACANGCTYDAGTSVSVSATGNSPWAFWYWQGNPYFSGASGTFAITGTTSMQAIFYAPLVTLYDGGATSGGTMTASGYALSSSVTPNNPASYSCNGDVGGCTAGWGFDQGSQVTVSATGDAAGAGCQYGCYLYQWTGAIGNLVKNTDGTVPKTFYISNFGTSSQGVNWQIPGNYCFNGSFFVPLWMYHNTTCGRADRSIPYTSGYTGIGAWFLAIVG